MDFREPDSKREMEICKSPENLCKTRIKLLGLQGFAVRNQKKPALKRVDPLALLWRK